MGEEQRWLIVDASGHVPGVAAELPVGHQVLLDAARNIAAILEPASASASASPLDDAREPKPSMIADADVISEEATATPERPEAEREVRLEEEN